MTRAITLVAVAALVLGAAGCSTVQPKRGAGEIEILDAARTKDCKRLGKTQVSVAVKIGVVPRGDKAIREDLQRLARNSAVSMGGDTLTPESAIEEGEQTFGVFQCIK